MTLIIYLLYHQNRQHISMFREVPTTKDYFPKQYRGFGLCIEDALSFFWVRNCISEFYLVELRT